MKTLACYGQPAESCTPQPPLYVSSIAVHPLAIMSISDHWTRSLSTLHAQAGDTLGVLLGQVLDGKLSVVASFELLVDRQCESSISIVEDKAKAHMERLQEVYVGMDVVGWYTFGDRLREAVHAPLHARLTEMFQNEGMLLLLMDASPQEGRQGGARPNLPVYVFESRAKAQNEFVQVCFAVEAEELETIAINAAIQAEQQASLDPDASLAATSSRLVNAASILKECIRVIIRYLSAVESGGVQADVELLRRIGSLCNRLPPSRGATAADDRNSQLATAQHREQLNALMTVYLGALGSLQAASMSLVTDSGQCGRR
jgi:COP9 signalosome complex subunit 6